MSDGTPTQQSKGLKRMRSECEDGLQRDTNPDGKEQRQVVADEGGSIDRPSMPHIPRAYRSRNPFPCVPTFDRRTTNSGISPLPQQHPRLPNTALLGCIVRQDFNCAVLSDALGQEGVDQCLSFHPNGLAVVQLAPTHPAVGNGESTIVAADFDAGGRNVLDSATVKGKKKKGALQLHTSTVLCSVTTKGGKKFEVCTGISGELIQANKALADNPGLMSEDPLGRGWLVIVRLKPRDLRRLNEAVGVKDGQ